MTALMLLYIGDEMCHILDLVYWVGGHIYIYDNRSWLLMKLASPNASLVVDCI